MAEAPKLPTLKRNSDPHKIRAYLSILIVMGFFAVLFLMLNGNVDAKESPTASMLLGSLGTAFAVVIAFYFGSSSGSERKSDLLASSEPLKEKAHEPKPA